MLNEGFLEIFFDSLHTDGHSFTALDWLDSCDSTGGVCLACFWRHALLIVLRLDFGRPNVINWGPPEIGTSDRCECSPLCTATRGVHNLAVSS
jgi:hypothetical protein